MKNNMNAGGMIWIWMTTMVSAAGCGGGMGPLTDGNEEAPLGDELIGSDNEMIGSEKDTLSAHSGRADLAQTMAGRDGLAVPGVTLAATGWCCVERLESGPYRHLVGCDDTSLPSPFAEFYCSAATIFAGGDYGTLLAGPCSARVECPRGLPPGGTPTPPGGTTPTPAPPCAGKCCEQGENGKCTRCIPRGGSCP